MFPWNRAIVVPSPINFVCKYCGKEHPQMNGSIVVCDCSGAQEAYNLERARAAAWKVEIQSRRKSGKK